MVKSVVPVSPPPPLVTAILTNVFVAKFDEPVAKNLINSVPIMVLPPSNCNGLINIDIIVECYYLAQKNYLKVYFFCDFDMILL